MLMVASPAAGKKNSSLHGGKVQETRMISFVR